MHINITCKTQHLHGLHPNQSSPQALFQPKHAPIHSEMSPSVIDVTDFSFQCEDNPGHYLRGVLGLLGQLGLRASHASSGCRVTDTRRGITEALGSSGRAGRSLLSTGRLQQSHSNFSHCTEDDKVKRRRAKIC